MPINSRKKGHDFERQVAIKFREAGFERCVTSRAQSRILDDKGVDLNFTSPFIVQCKAVEALAVHKALNDIPAADGHYRVLFSKKKRQGTVVVMEVEEFFRLIADGVIPDRDGETDLSRVLS